MCVAYLGRRRLCRELLEVDPLSLRRDKHVNLSSDVMFSHGRGDTAVVAEGMPPRDEKLSCEIEQTGKPSLRARCDAWIKAWCGVVWVSKVVGIF